MSAKQCPCQSAGSGAGPPIPTKAANGKTGIFLNPSEGSVKGLRASRYQSFQSDKAK